MSGEADEILKCAVTVCMCEGFYNFKGSLSHKN